MVIFNRSSTWYEDQNASHATLSIVVISLNLQRLFGQKVPREEGVWWYSMKYKASQAAKLDVIASIVLEARFLEDRLRLVAIRFQR